MKKLSILDYEPDIHSAVKKFFLEFCQSIVNAVLIPIFIQWRHKETLTTIENPHWGGWNEKQSIDKLIVITGKYRKHFEEFLYRNIELMEGIEMEFLSLIKQKFADIGNLTDDQIKLKIALTNYCKIIIFNFETSNFANPLYSVRLDSIKLITANEDTETIFNITSILNIAWNVNLLEDVYQNLYEEECLPCNILCEREENYINYYYKTYRDIGVENEED